MIFACNNMTFMKENTVNHGEKQYIMERQVEMDLKRAFINLGG